MIIRKIFGLLILFVSVIHSSGFIDSQDLKVVSEREAEKNLHNDYLYRVFNGKSFVYYHFGLNSIVYEGKNFFKIPEGVTMHNSTLYSDGEMLYEAIFNKDYILLDGVKTIQLEFKGKKETLHKVDTPKSFYVSSNVDATLVFIENGERNVLGELPYYVSSSKYYDSYLLVLPKSTDYVFKEIKLEGKKEIKLEKIDIKLSVSPNLKFSKKEFPNDMGDIEDERKIAWVDSISIKIQEEKKNNEKMKDGFIALLKDKMYIYHEKNDNEKEDEYKINKVVFDYLIDASADEMLLKSGYKLIQSSYNQRLELLESYKKELMKSDSETGHLLNQVFFAEISVNVAKNLTYEATKPGPSMLHGGSIAIQYYHPMTDRINWFSRSLFNYSRWYYNENFTEYSTSNLFAADVGVVYPFKPPINIKNLVKYVDLNPFIRVGYNMLDIKNDTPITKGSLAVGGGFGIDLRITSFPIILGGNYAYTSNKFGDMTAFIKVPFLRLGK